MANRNEFLLIKIKSMKRFKYINRKNECVLKDMDKERIGFYHLVLEGITGIIEQDDPRCSIIDSEYNKYVNNLEVDDLGMDVVYISEQSVSDIKEIDIKLFNFKYREKFSPNKTKTENDISRSTKFLEYITNGERQDETKNTIVAKEINKIIDLLEGNYICNITLYMVSNEAKGFEEKTNEYINILEKSYGMKVVNISLDEIVGFFNIKKENYKSRFVIDSDDFLQFQSDEKSTQISYILKLPLLELVRITSNNVEVAKNYVIEDDNIIAKSKLEFSLLYDNVRGFLGETKYNKSIINTLKTKHRSFFMFNNGITITAENIEAVPINSKKKYPKIAITSCTLF